MHIDIFASITGTESVSRALEVAQAEEKDFVVVTNADGKFLFLTSVLQLFTFDQNARLDTLTRPDQLRLDTSAARPLTRDQIFTYFEDHPQELGIPILDPDGRVLGVLSKDDAEDELRNRFNFASSGDGGTQAPRFFCPKCGEMRSAPGNPGGTIPRCPKHGIPMI